MYQILNELLPAVYAHYAIGVPAIYEEYFGYQIYKKKIQDKLSILDNDEPIPNWSDFIKELQDKLDEEIHLLDKSYEQFPSYSLTFLKLRNYNVGDMEINIRLTLCASLLCNYFTVFFEEHQAYRRFESEGIERKLLIYFDQPQLSKVENDVKDTLLQAFKKHFPSYNFVSHRPLFTYRIVGGIPYGEIYVPVNKFVENIDYPVYNYLFSRYPSGWEKFSILR